MSFSKELIHIYELLYDCYGPQNWWPGETSDEIIIGALLTQNTNWKNVEIAIDNLKTNNLLILENIHNAELNIISKCILSSGYYNQKAERLKDIAKFFCSNYSKNFATSSLYEKRNALLGLKGIGPETADSILLYAFLEPIFVVDTYTKRIFQRLAYFSGKESYSNIQKFFMNNIRKDVTLFNEFHALLVHHAKECCQKNPHCSKCVLIKICKYENNI